MAINIKTAIPVFIFLVSIAGIVFIQTAFAENLQEKIPWNKNRPLQWSDFKGTVGQYPDDFSGREYYVNAFTRTWVEANWYVEKTDSPSCQYKITKIDTVSFFLPYQSWKRDDTQLTSYLLKHEQGHFDIAQIHAKKFNTLQNQKFPCPGGIFDLNKINDDISKKFQQNLKELNKMDLQYDKETNGSLDKEKQQIWNNKIQSLLGSSETKSKPSDCKGTKLCITGKITKIIDGDTLWIKLANGTKFKIRLSLTSTDELKTKEGVEIKSGVKASNFLKNICPVDSSVIVDQDDKQLKSYDRILGKVICNGKNLNAELLSSGHATIWKQYCKKSEFANEDWAIKYGCSIN